MSNTSIAAPAICLFFNTLIKACSSTIGPRDALINQAVGFILSSSAAPTRPRVRLLNTKWIVRMSARSNSWSLETRIAPAALAASDVMFWLQAIRFIPKALPTRATCDPIRPSIKRQQPLNHGVRIGEVVLKYGDVRSIAEHRPIGALQRHILVIVQNSNLVLLHSHPSRGDSFERSSRFDISLRAPCDCQEQVGGWEFFLHSINKAIRIFGFFEFF